MTHVVNLVGGQHQVLTATQFEKRQRPIVNVLSLRLEFRGDRIVVESNHLTGSRKTRKKNSRFFKTLPNRRNPIGETTRGNLQQI